MRTPKHIALYNIAIENLAKAQEYFIKAVRQVAKNKGFTPEQIEMFDGTVESSTHKRDNEIIFNGDFVELDFNEFCNLSKREIVNKMWEYVTEENRQKLRPSYKTPDYK